MQVIRYKATGRYENDSFQKDLFVTKQQAEEWLEDFDEMLPIEEVVYKVKCDKCGCESMTLDDDLNYDESLIEHWKDCSTLLEDEPNLD